MSDAQPISNLELQQTVQLDMRVSEARSPLSRPQSAEIPVRSAEPENKGPRQSSPQQASDNEQDDSFADMTPDQAFEGDLQEATAQADFQYNAASTLDVEMTDSSSSAPDPDVLAPASAKNSTEISQHHDGLVKSSAQLIDVADGESDPYEPPEATPPPEEAISTPDSPPFSPAPPETISGGSHADKQYNDISISPDEAIVSKHVRHADDLALPPAQANQVFSSTPDASMVSWLTSEQDNSTLASRKTFFTPYESPLKNFRAFRFHPTFEKEVQGGFKSITYSNNIKDGKELCRYELAGGTCNDVSCEFQHFRDMGLAGASVSAWGISYF